VSAHHPESGPFEPDSERTGSWALQPPMTPISTPV